MPKQHKSSWFQKIVAASFVQLCKLWPCKILIIAVSLVLCTMFGYYDWAIHQPRDFSGQTWTIKRGDTLRQVMTQLQQRNITHETVSIRLLAYLYGLERQIQVGEYRFSQETTLNQFLQSITRGQNQVTIKVTIVEGWTFAQMRVHLKQAPQLKQESAGMSDQQIMAALGHPELSAEGRFFPDTYYYIPRSEDLSIYRQAFELMESKLNAAWKNRAKNLTLESKDEALILASIIEKESQLVGEQAEIAGVFHNRLKKKMRLQADPTVIYGLGESYKGNITRAHLKKDTPYNTYTRYGLPPTPIGLPGDQSLKATVQPATTGAYYFVAKGDGDGHFFSDTLEQHNEAVQRYRRLRNRE